MGILKLPRTYGRGSNFCASSELKSCRSGKRSASHDLTVGDFRKGGLKLLLYILLITFPIGVIIRINLIPSAYIYPVDIVLFIIFVSSIIGYSRNHILLFNNPIFKPLLLFLIIALVTLIINLKYLNLEYFVVSFLYLLRFLVYSNLLFVLKMFDQTFLKKYLLFVSFSGFAFVVFGILQYIFYPDLRGLYYLGWDEHLYRMFSTFLDPNFAGPVFALEFLLLLGLILSKIYNNKFIKYYFVIGIFLSFMSIFFTYSRSTFIMLLMSLMSFLVLIKKKKLIILALLFFALGILILPKDIKSEGVVLLRTASILSREESYRRAIIIFRDSPLTGIGFNAYRYAQNRYNFSDPRNWETTHPGSGVSNSFLFVLVTTGIIGFIIYSYFIINIILSVLQVKINNKNINLYLKAIVLSSIIGVMSHSIFENSLFYPFIMIWLFGIIGCFLALRKN